MTITLGEKVLLTREKIDKISCSLYLFVLVFAPPLIPYPHLFLTILSFLALATTYRGTAWRIVKKSGIYNWVMVMVLLVLYTVCVPLPVSMICGDIVNLSHYISVINRYGVLVVAVSVCATYLLCMAEKKRYSYDFLIECLINAGLIESCCSILAFLSPKIKSLFIFFMKRFSESYLYTNTWYITVRAYGFASTLVDVFGLGIGIIAGVCFFYGIIGKKRYIIESLIIAVATLLNSRTGVLVYAIAVALSIAYVVFKGNPKMVLTTFAAIGLLAVGALLVLEIMKTNEYTTGWVQAGVSSITNFLHGGKSQGDNDAMALLFRDDYWNYPPFPRILVGTGHSLYGANGYIHSDVGYVNELWLFGVFGCTLLYGSIAEMCIRLKKKTQISMFKYAAVFIMAAYFFFNIKGAALGYNPGAVAMFLIIFIGKWQTE